MGGVSKYRGPSAVHAVQSAMLTTCSLSSIEISTHPTYVFKDDNNYTLSNQIYSPSPNEGSNPIPNRSTFPLAATWNSAA